MELFNYLDERYRDMYAKQIIPKPSDRRKRSLRNILIFTISIIMGILLEEFGVFFWNTIFFPLLIFGPAELLD